MNSLNSNTTPGKRFFFFLIAAFLILAPISLSGIAVQGELSTAKVLRISTLLLCFIAGLPWFRTPKSSSPLFSLLLLSSMYLIAALWSSSPLYAFAYKSLFFASIVSGICVGNALKSEGDFRSLGRITTSAGLVSLLLIAYVIAFTDEWEMWKGRLVVAKINPNLLGSCSAIFFLLGTFHLIIKETNYWRLLSITSIVSMLSLAIISGSRGALLMDIGGALVLLPGLTRRRRQTFLAVMAAFIGTASLLYFTFQEEVLSTDETVSIQDPKGLRIFAEISRDTRLNVWNYGLKQFYANPMLGNGWNNVNNRWMLVQSSFLQIMIECGIIGLVILIIFLFSVFKALARATAIWRRKRAASQFLPVFIAATVAMLLHATIECALVTGSNGNAVLLALALTQVSNLLETVSARDSRNRSILFNRTWSC